MKRRKDGRWVRAVSINGKPRYFYSTAETESKAEKDIRRQIAAFQETAINGPLFTEVAEEWRAIHLPTLSVTTLRGYTPAINDAISYFDKKKVKEITTRNVTAYLAYIASQGYAQKTLNNKKIVLNLIMKYAVSQGIIEINPVNDAITPKKLPKKKRRTLTRQEMRLVREHRHDSWCAYFAFFLMSTGLRRGEALALTYGDFQAAPSASQSIRQLNMSATMRPLRIVRKQMQAFARFLSMTSLSIFFLRELLPSLSFLGMGKLFQIM